ncbi:flagellar basal-body MS-ring/collar protein FliF [Cognatiyoonia sp. IB215182]|uniref:flagellar basal-body MS-ring/collar protein FliF n=1 Tax=Cognatiyoonia sp. IB215182 TaxID=3097353 RepID=UPI002A1738FA|nr:flagellar basal-body MS-ring/collar protein FliF [Cognatiyoonia sp. IB215182]MDX8352885.1 flagellar basal-body MS-ring/collar protein FliF [Cognatiyoonia sp. IB215182]
MQSLGTVWAALDAKRRVFVILATIAVFAAILLLARGAGTKDMSLLFGGLETRAAGDVIGALDQRGVPYEVRGGAIYVPTSQRDVLRMALASEGLPAMGSQGYELLDSLSGFSTTSQMFDAAYWRAKEGELARTILASPHIRSARVHISTPATRPFQRNEAPTAAVTVTTAGGSLSTPHIKALQYLVGSAVPGLAPDAVAVIDDNGGLMSDADGGAANASSDERAETLRLRAERLLAARVGAGNAVVELSLDTVTESEAITERLVDPDSRIAISTDVTESAGTSSDSRGGDVTVASNLPDGDAGGAAGSSANESSESRTLTNYEISETERQILRAPGAVRRLTVAVLVNDVTTIADDGTTVTEPRSDEELAALEELVASAVGFDADRGDVITLKSMSFEPIVPLGTEVATPSAGAPLDTMQLIQVGVLAVVALILGLFVVRPILAPSRLLPPPTTAEAQDSEDDDLPMFGMAELPSLDAGDLGMMDEGDDPVQRLRQMISERETETIQILQDWIDDPVTKEQA